MTTPPPPPLPHPILRYCDDYYFSCVETEIVHSYKRFEGLIYIGVHLLAGKKIREQEWGKDRTGSWCCPSVLVWLR